MCGGRLDLRGILLLRRVGGKVVVEVRMSVYGSVTAYPSVDGHEWGLWVQF